jgi:hypothetical protein
MALSLVARVCSSSNQLNDTNIDMFFPVELAMNPFQNIGQISFLKA